MKPVKKLFNRLSKVRIWQAWLLILCLDTIAFFGVTRLGYDDGLIHAFESKSDSFVAFQEFQIDFPGNGHEVFLLLESESFAKFDSLLNAADFALEANLLDGVDGSASGFTVPIIHGLEGETSIFPDQDVTDAELHRHLSQAYEHDPGLRRFLSEDHRKLLIILQVADPPNPKLFTQVEQLARTFFDGSDVTMTQTGFPGMRNDMLSRLLDDFLVINIIGIIVGTIVSGIALNSMVFATLTGMSAGTALLWVLGVMGLTGTQISVITVALPLLILVLAFSTAMHLTVETRNQVLQGAKRPVSLSIWRIGPASMLAAATTALAFFVLALSPSALVADMGRAGVLGTFLSLIAVITVHPLLFCTLARIRPLVSFYANGRSAPSRVAHWSFLPNLACRWPKTLSILSLGVVVLSAGLYSSAESNFSLYENFKPNHPMRQSISKIEQNLAPVGTLHFLADMNGQQDAATFENIHGILERHTAGFEVVSFASVSHHLDLDGVPDALQSRFFSKDAKSAVFTVLFPYENARITRQRMDEMEVNLSSDAEARAYFTQPPTGLAAMTSVTSKEMLVDMNRGFLIAVAASGLLMAIWLRSPVAGLISLVPNILPIAIIGAWLAYSGRGLEFSSGIALTIAFGLAVDDTVHVFNRLRLNNALQTPASPMMIINAVKEVSPILVITSAVLSFGLIGTQFASLPSLAYFGSLSIAVFVLAVVADLVVLPALLIVASMVSFGRHAK